MADGLLDPYPANGGAKQKQHEDWYADYSQRPMTPRDKSPRGVSPGGRSPSARSPRATSPFSHAAIMPRDAERAPRKLILCFDGTGNKFHGDESDSNILKIFRMLDRSAGDQYHYYQPGIGTYVISDSLSHSGLRARISSWYQKAKDSAIGSSFDQHVVGGYRFLMRFYQTGDEIYMFGFSRGAYIARFLAEMLDYIGLLCHGNEEMVKFAWKAFAQWQARKPPSKEAEDEANESEEDRETRRMYNYMKGFRETFSRPVGRIKFLGLFDTVNSVPRFEAAWMQRTKFPYTARTSARFIRHAVSIDERRAKFRQDLLYQKPPKHEHHRRVRSEHMAGMIDRIRRSIDVSHAHSEEKHALPPVPIEKERHGSQFLAPGDAGRGRRGAVSHKHHYAPYRARSRSRQRMAQGALMEDQDNMSCSDASQWEAEMDDWQNEDQDIDEVWFAGGHGDIGGGWEALDGRKSASHVPLSWMVREAMKAGLSFDLDNITEMGCQDVFDKVRPSARGMKSSRASQPAIQVEDEAGHVQGAQIGQSSPDIGPRDFAPGIAPDSDNISPFHELMHKAHTSRIHDSLEYGGGLGYMAVSAWKFMEYLPFRRMDLQPDGSWKPIRWPLPCGEVRDMPNNVRVHGSVIRRLKEDETYRPGNLIIGGGGRGVRRAPAEYGIGDWICVAGHGDPIGEIWEKKPKEVNGNGTNGTNGTNGARH
ncbi:oxidoreductase, short chain dehydrogenase/reductase family [Metarhizium anisopliae]